MSPWSMVFSVLLACALILMMAPGVLAFNRGRVLQNLAICMAVAALLGLFYKNFGPESDHPLFSMPEAMQARSLHQKPTSPISPQTRPDSLPTEETIPGALPKTKSSQEY